MTHRYMSALLRIADSNFDIHHDRKVPTRDSCIAAIGRLFDYVVSACEQGRGDGEAESLGGSQIDGQLEFGWLLHG